MSRLELYIQAIQIHLLSTHASILEWFKETDQVKSYRPADGGWTIKEILEHIALTSRYLMILIEKGSEKAIKNVQDKVLSDLLVSYNYDLSKVDDIGVHKSFNWIRPEHMEPTNTKSEFEIIDELISHIRLCLMQLNKLNNGEGLLYETTMTVNDLGKLNVYEYIYFLSKHAERHIQQMDENKREYFLKTQ